jgi:hypothetical protein
MASSACGAWAEGTPRPELRNHRRWIADRGGVSSRLTSVHHHLGCSAARSLREGVAQRLLIRVAMNDYGMGPPLNDDELAALREESRRTGGCWGGGVQPEAVHPLERAMAFSFGAGGGGSLGMHGYTGDLTKGELPFLGLF